jgi:hypothetical protein
VQLEVKVSKEEPGLAVVQVKLVQLVQLAQTVSKVQLVSKVELD